MEKINIKKSKILELSKILNEKYKNLNMKISINRKNFILNTDKNLKYEEFKEIELLVKRFFPDYRIKIEKQ
ncbi:MAG: hypothetical protein ACP5JU_00740 [Minisyncoccia bacterium]